MKICTTKLIKNILLIVGSAFIQCFVIQSMMKSSGLIAMGFTGLALLLHMGLNIVHVNISISVFLIVLNLPVALVCAKSISKKFTLMSLLQIVLASIFLVIFNFKPVFTSVILNVTVGAFIYGLQLVMALRAGGSTGGTDFIALYVANKISKTIWEYIFAFNAILLLALGFLFGWDKAGYSLIFQFVTTYTVNKFYTRYVRVTIQVITACPDEIIQEYMKVIHHGITKARGEGGYSKKEYGILYAVVSSSDVRKVVDIINRIDSNAIINIYKTEDFYGKFHLDPI
ncbi:YitT family protein [Sneathia sanguinegens]|uniref:YitT family protein n=1 Tax=Sneathia sanguinegens TaxID=40543 RepID=UPI002586236B|nr:YitT family protein [Sneathia sanguinegens]MDU4652654.1 YitT family protein [Sneathia sanguinegens]MDU7497361.1 YitT family protein [Sneathia sanguinegens]